MPNIDFQQDCYNIDEPHMHGEQIKNCIYLASAFDNLDEIDPSTGTLKRGSVLVFLPGIGEIENVYKALAGER